MPKIHCNMITQRSIEEGAAMEKGKTNPDYFEACSICEMHPDDMKKAGIWKNTNVRVTSECGTVIVKAIDATQYVPPRPCPHQAGRLGKPGCPTQDPVDRHPAVQWIPGHHRTSHQ